MRGLFTLFLTIIISTSFAQENKQSIFTFGYTHQLPIGDLAEYFGDNSSIGFSFLIEKENNIFYGIEGDYLFGGSIKDSTIFKNIITSTGALIGADGHYANINLMERGIASYIFIGYAIHTYNSKTRYFPYLHNLNHNNLSGFYLSTGVGFLQHQIFIDTKDQNIPQLNEEYKKGYDRLTNGISTKWEASYKYYSKNGKFQMGAGINYTMAYTKNQRDYNFKENEYYPNSKSWDKLLGFKIEIIIPIHRKNEEEFHYF